MAKEAKTKHLDPEQSWPGGYTSQKLEKLAGRFAAGEDLKEEQIVGELAYYLIKKQSTARMALNSAKRRGRWLGLLGTHLKPVVHPRATTRLDPEEKPEDDLLQVEMRMSDWVRIKALFGHMDGQYLMSLPPSARPSPEFIEEIEELYQARPSSTLLENGTVDPESSDEG